ncbi:hypothetical protein QCA50_000473 [Cerrena zonata]|uniref:Uncharacterized protein n=1 Tax=Cerrena zonata TaxID=2478898 RepID=A0AAW0GRG5_9APHY
MLHEAFQDQVRISRSAPVQVQGGGISMIDCDKDILIGAFERLVVLRIFVSVAAPTAGISKEFVQVQVNSGTRRCQADSGEVWKDKSQEMV